MKLLLLFLALTFQTPEVLTNNDVIDLVLAKLSPEIIVAKIERTPCRFDTSPETLEKLKIAGVPTPVLLAMVKASPSKPAAEAKPEKPTRKFERGGPSELRGVKTVYVYTGSDSSARENIVGEVFGKTSGLKLVNDIEEADVILAYGSEADYFLTGFRTNTTHSSRTVTTYPGGATIGPGTSSSDSTPTYRKVTYGAGVVVKKTEDAYRILMNFGDSRSTVFERRPSTNFARAFVKAYQDANGQNH